MLILDALLQTSPNYYGRRRKGNMSAILEFWQNLPSKMDPVVFELGSFRLQYYGLMYILAFLTTYTLALYRCKTESRFKAYTSAFHQDIMTAAFIGVLLGGRLGYVLFYNFAYYIQQPLEIILPFRFNPFRFVGLSGMSYHGGLIGVFIATAIFCKKRKISFWEMADLYGPIIPLGYAFGRLGNFINGELYGRVTSSALGMYFPSAPALSLRHPSQLYEMLAEGIIAFIIMWSLRKRKFPLGFMAGGYLIVYGCLRFFVEFFREPDAHLGFVLPPFSMGQLLCMAMIAIGLFLCFSRFQKQKQLN